jgi:glycosyltransferase involved in cell wall biosynthesis
VGDVMARSRAVIAPFRSMLGTVDVPLSLLEGMAVGVPVIGSAIGGIPEIVEDEVNGLLVPPQAPRRLADAMLKLLDNDDLCHQMGVYGREMVQAFSVDRVAANLLDDYTRD